MKAAICPVCNGIGKVRAPSIQCIELIKCHGCQGKGWVEVHDDYPPVEEWVCNCYTNRTVYPPTGHICPGTW